MKRSLAICCAALALFAAACDMLETPEPGDKNEKAKGLVVISISGADQSGERTLIPTLPDLVYMITAEAEDSSPVTQPLASSGGSIALTPGFWTITLKAYVSSLSAENLMLQGRGSITVQAGQTKSLTIGMAPVTGNPETDEEFTGTLSYDVTFPDNLNYGVLNVFPVEGGEPIKAIDLWHTSTAAGSGVKQATGEVSIPAGYYRITTRFNLADGGVQKYAGKTEVLHIYKDLTTNAPYTFTAENFFPLNTTGTERRVVTTIFGDPTSLQGILANMPPNTRDTPYIIAIKDLKIDGTETSPTKITGTAADPLVNLFNLLNGRYVSYDLSGMTGTAIPDVSPTDTTIAARQNKDRVVSVILPSGLTSIGAYTFSGCTSLTEVVYNPGTVTSIGAFAFENCSSLASIELPAADNSVGASAFSGCTSLYAISIPSTWTTIPANAFEGTGIREITIPAAITGIGNSAFQDCASLTTVTLTNPVTAGTGLFVRCTSLSSIDLSKLVTTAIPASLFNGCSALASVDIPSSVTSIGNSAFKDCASLTSITLPSGLTALGTSTIGSVFSGTGITSITIPTGVTTIRNNTFKDCTSLASVTLHDAISSIGNGAFNGCTALTSITLPSSLTGTSGLGSMVFNGCSALTSIDIPAGVSRLNDQVFQNTTSLTSITIRYATGVIATSGYALTGLDTTKTGFAIYVPSGLVQNYRDYTFTPWSEIADSVFQAIP